jgi:hypothetical protein
MGGFGRLGLCVDVEYGVDDRRDVSREGWISPRNDDLVVRLHFCRASKSIRRMDGRMNEVNEWTENCD